ncbi:cupin domain-containing protein [Roseomonas sp. 18066]|uniref:cupin domain-containing protein n=1 Tax=Roseomonas sp. 18066 TaxID=2681412 RepID=UPI001358E724|nr:cupin domain-containing protein [Roseomonas sp. 18066]
MSASLTTYLLDFRQPAQGGAPLAGLDWLPGAGLAEGRMLRHQPEHGYAVAEVSLSVFSGALPALDKHVFLLVQAGAVTVGGETIKTGETVVLPRGFAGPWAHAEGTRLVVISYVGEAPAAGAALAPVRPDVTAPLEPCGGPSAALLTTTAPSCAKRMSFEDSTEQFEIGVWGSTPYARRPNAFGHDELMFLLEGAVTITDPDGVAATYKAGEGFLIPRGTPCAWENTVPVKKVFVCFSEA